MSETRRHDLDALRAAAMLLGLAYHAALSFAAGLPWLVQDASQSRALYWFQAASHGFRMPLFFLLSGFFTAMLWRKRGLKALLRQRFKRVLLPCLLGLVTVVPAMLWVSGKAIETRVRQAQTAASPVGSSPLAQAVLEGDRATTARLLASGADVNALDDQFGIPPLTLAALKGDTHMTAQLLDAGAEVNRRHRDGNTPLHAAAFLGRTGVVELLIARGADLQVRNPTGDSPLNAAESDWATTMFIAGVFRIGLDRAQVEQGRAQVIARLEGLGVGRNRAGPAAAAGIQPGRALGAILRGLIQTPVFLLVWFLWFLCWLVAGFAVYAWIAERRGWKGAPRWLLLSPGGMAVWVALTLVPQAFMNQGMFGPDTYMGLLPAPHVLVYYALFFGFGALYYDADDTESVLGRHWRWALPATLLIVFPLALEFTTGRLGLREMLLPERYHRPASLAGQVLFAWLMTFGCMGMVRSLLTRENRTIRYLSDSAYWLYLSHLPLMIGVQMVIQGWPGPAIAKCALLTVAITAFLLLVYEKAVRYTWLGTLLNGPRTRPARTLT